MPDLDVKRLLWLLSPSISGLYTKIYSKTRVMFTIGLVVFAGMLLLHNGIAVYGYFAMAPLYSDKSLPTLHGYTWLSYIANGSSEGNNPVEEVESTRAAS